MSTTTQKKLPASWDKREKLRDKGQFWTPDWVADPMVAYAAQEADVVFDPGVGKGVFYTALRKLLQRKSFLVQTLILKLSPKHDKKGFLAMMLIWRYATLF